jgi:hypothetical protein
MQRWIDHLGTGGDHDRACLPGTRQSLLTRIGIWMDDPAQRIFWLSGVAGCGKSSVAMTIGMREAASKRLGAQFYFS